MQSVVRVKTSYTACSMEVKRRDSTLIVIRNILVVWQPLKEMLIHLREGLPFVIVILRISCTLCWNVMKLWNVVD